MPSPIIGSFAQILAENRSRFNSKFAAARRYDPKLDAAAFGDHVRSVVAPLVEAVDRENPATTAEAAEALYDLSLDLIAQEFLGPNSRYPYVADGWRVLLPRLPRFIAESPRQFVGSVTNALYNLSATPGARPHEWAASLLDLAEICSDAETLLKAGQVAAWRAGLAHFRTGALELCQTLEPRIARAALGLSPTDENPPIEAMIKSLLADPWLPPIYADEHPSKDLRLEIVARVGAFRGFGGLFLTPPVVTSADGQFYVSDGQRHWLLTADIFGATLHRADETPRRRDAKPPLPFQIEKDGKVACRSWTRSFPELENFKSAAANETTLAVTSPLSHAVYLIALVSL